MSLIHDALKSMDAPQGPAPAAARAPASAPRRRPAWLDALVAFGVVLGAGVLGWFVWQNQRQPKADFTPAAVAPAPKPAMLDGAAPSSVAAAAPTATEAIQPVQTSPVAAAPVEPVAKAEPVAAAALPTPTVLSSGAQSNVSAVPAPSPAPAARSVAIAKGAVSPPSGDQPSASVQASARVAPVRQPLRGSNSAAPVAPAPAVDDTPVELRFARFVAAMKETRTQDAERELAALKERLPAGSLGLMRAQAWFDLRAGRDAAAADGYRSILERMPGDEEAAINLASIQSRQHKTEEARATLDAAARLQPDSAALRAALAQFTPAARQ